MRVRVWLIAGSSALVVGLAVTLIVTVGGGHPSRAAAHPQSSPTIPAADAGPQVAAALNGLATDPSALVASGAVVQGPVSQAVPPGSTVSSDVRSWAPDGIGGGTMLVTVTPPGGKPVTYAAVMVQQDGRWKV